MPVCDHYCGVASRMRKSLDLQAAMSEEFGACVFDVTLDCEDGAPIGGEKDHAMQVAALAQEAHARASHRGLAARVAVRVHAVDHPAFEEDVALIVGQAAQALCHVMIPKVESPADVRRAAAWVAQCAAQAGRKSALPLHVLVESSRAVHQVFDIAAQPEVASVSFGLMDFVSSHAGAIGASALLVADDPSQHQWGQFSHPLVLRAKLEIAAACHAHGKVASHSVVTELNDTNSVRQAAQKAHRALGYLRMWSIHPSQIRPILAAFAPAAQDIAQATAIITAAMQQDWAPISWGGQLHDRASYRYYWQLLERAHQTGQTLPDAAQGFFGHATAH
jgi:citrate lyase subunit beta/citryl-CoA lyase